MAYYGLILTWVLDYLRPGATSPVVGALKLYTVVPLGTFLISLATQSRASHGQIVKSPSLHWLLFFLLWILLSASVALNTEATFMRLNAAFGYVLMFYVIVRVGDDVDRINGLMRALAMIHIVLIVLNPDILLKPEERTYLAEVTFLGDGNDFALSVCFVFPMVFYVYNRAQSRFWKSVYLALLVTLALAVIGTQSRGGSLGIAASLFYIWWKGRNKALGAIAIAMLLVAGLLFAGPAYFSRMSTLANVDADGSAQGRLDAWAVAAYEGGVKSPVLGVGAGNFPLYNHGHTAHSIYFLALGELGIPGAIFAVGYIVWNLRRNSRTIRRLEKGPESVREAFRPLFVYLSASTVGLAVAGAFLSALYYPHIFIMGGLSLAAHLSYQRVLDERAKGDPPEGMKRKEPRGRESVQAGIRARTKSRGDLC